MKRIEINARPPSFATNKQPLLASYRDYEYDKSEKSISLCDAFCEIAYLGYPMVIAQLFPPLTSTITNVVLGHEDDAILLAGYGLGALTVAVLGLTISQIFTIGTGTFTSQAFGA